MHQSVNNLVFFLFFINLYFIFIETKSSEKTSFSFPTVKRIPKTWSFKSINGNVSYTEDYYWMESVNKTDKDLSKFVNDQSILTESYMRKCKNRDAIVKSIQDANKYNYIGNLALYGEDHNPIYVYSFQGANDQRALWYIATMDEFQASKKTNFYPPPGKMFLNESLLSKDNSASIEQVVISPDTKIFAYLTTTTSTFGTWYFRETSSPLVTAKTTPPGGEGKLPLEIPLCTYPIQWFNDNSGFFYPQHLDDKGGTVLEHRDKIRFHKWNTDYSQDITIFDAGDLGEGVPTTYFFTQITDDNRWLIVSGYKGSDAYLLSYATFLPKQTISENMKWIVLAPKYEFTMWPVTVIDDWYYFQTDYQTINGRVAKMFMDSSKAKTVKKFNELQDRPKIIEVIKERKDAQLATQNTAVYAIAHDKAILIYQENGQNTYYLYDLLSGKKLQHLLANESISSAALNVYGQSNLAQASFSSFDTPEKVYEFKFDKDHIEVSIVSTQIIEGASPDQFEIQELYAISKDGTKIPYFVTSRKGTQKPGPVWMHSYAAYGKIFNMIYDPGYFAWLNSYNGFFVWCAARGGGDEGGYWHDSAKRIHKQNTMDDILACSQDLVKRKIAIKGEIILESDSAGAMAIAAVVNQAPPGLIGAALLERAVLDIFQIELRSSIGQANTEEFGDVNNQTEVASILAWSPLQNIDPKKPFPAILTIPGAEDSLVSPSNTYKYMAQLQYTHQSSIMPLLMFVAQGSGHKFSSVTVDEYTLEETHQICLTEVALGLKRR